MKIKNISTHSLAVMLIMLMGFTVTACHDDDNASTDANIGNSEEYVADPTEDQKEVTFSGKTAVIDYDFDDMGLAIFSRLSNKTGELDDDVDAVLLSPKTLDSDFAINEAVQLVKLYEQGTTIILVEPSNENWQKLGTLLKKAEEQIATDTTMTIDVHRLVDRWKMLQAQSGENSAYGKQDAVALRLNDTYIISDLQEQADYCTRATGEATQDVTDYCYGKSADLLMEWLENAEENKAEMNAKKAEFTAVTRASSSSPVSLTSLATAQMVTVQRSVGPTPCLNRTMPYEFKYTIYSLYNVTSDEEYYFIRQHIDYHCARLGCTKNGQDEWTKLSPTKNVKIEGKTKEVEWVFGPYMCNSEVTTTLKNLGGGETVHLLDPKPITGNGTQQSNSSGFSWHAGAGFLYQTVPSSEDIYGGGLPQLALTAGITYQVSYSASRTGLTYTQKSKDNVQTTWLMEASKPKINGAFTSGDHTTLSELQYTDWNTDLTWYFRIEHPDKSRRYSLSVQDITEVGELPYKGPDNGITVQSTLSHTVELVPPDRFRQEWYMTCGNADLRTTISSQLSTLWTDNPVTTALSEEGLEENMTASFTKIKNSVKAIGPKLARQGYTGKYTFRVRKKGARTDFMSFILNNGVVE